MVRVGGLRHHSDVELVLQCYFWYFRTERVHAGRRRFHDMFGILRMALLIARSPRKTDWRPSTAVQKKAAQELLASIVLSCAVAACGTGSAVRRKRQYFVKATG
jgi:hypothetical protein